MTRETPQQRALHLKARYDAADLGPEEQHELAQLLRTQAACRQAIGADIVFDRLLQLHARAPSAEEVGLGVRQRREAEATASRFMRSVRPRTRIRQRRRPMLSWQPLAWVGAAAAAAAIVLLSLLPPASGPTAAVQVRAASLASSGGSALAPGMALAPGQSVSTGAGGSLSLVFADGSLLTLDEWSELRMQSLQPAKDLRLVQGALSADIRPQTPGHPLSIGTPHAQATILGTRFTLSAGTSTILEVASGRVRLIDQAGRAQEVTAGGRAEVGAPAPTPVATPWAEAAARYDFSAGTGSIVHDRSSAGLDLAIRDPAAVSWLPDGGLRIDRPTRLRSLKPATVLTAACQSSGAITVILDIEPMPAAAEVDLLDYPKRIICLPQDLDERNFSLGQGRFQGPTGVFDMRIQTSTGTRTGRPSVATAGVHVAAQRMSVAFTRDTSGRCSFFIDGRQVPVLSVDADNLASATAESVLVPGTLDPWDPSLHLTLAAEAVADEHGSRAWTGTFYGAAIFARALDARELALLHRR